jgi:hypothetical protein
VLAILTEYPALWWLAAPSFVRMRSHDAGIRSP